MESFVDYNYVKNYIVAIDSKGKLFRAILPITLGHRMMYPQFNLNVCMFLDAIVIQRDSEGTLCPELGVFEMTLNEYSELLKIIFKREFGI